MPRPAPDDADAEVLIIGGGAAGLSAALVLGRSLRRTIVLNDGPPRNATAPHAHSFFTRDGEAPLELLRIGRAQLSAYEHVALVDARAVAAWTDADLGFGVRTADNRRFTAQRLILATGVIDELPPIDGLQERWGEGVFHCPYCDGYETRGQPMGVLAAGADAVELAAMIRQWTDDVIVFTHGPDRLSASERAVLQDLGVGLRESPITRLTGPGRSLESIELADGTRVARSRLMIKVPHRQRSDLAVQLGCAMSPEGYVVVTSTHETSVTGVYAAGDCCGPHQQLVFAAAAGAMAAIRANHDLVVERTARETPQLPTQ